MKYEDIFSICPEEEYICINYNNNYRPCSILKIIKINCIQIIKFNFDKSKIPIQRYNNLTE